MFRALVLGSFLLIGTAAFAQDTARPSTHIKSTTAIATIDGDGQKVAAVALEYDHVIDTAKLATEAYAVDGRTVAKVYANTTAAQADHGVDGPFVIVELAPASAPSSAPSRGPRSDDHREAGGPPPGFAGPKLGEKSDKPAVPQPLTATITQKTDILTTEGTVCAAIGTPLTTTAMISPMMQGFRQLVFQDPAFGNAKLMYNLYIPENYDRTRKYPLVLFMADAGAVSNNPVETLTQGLGAVIWATPAEQAKHACFVLAPQYNCIIADDTSTTTEQMDMTVDLLKELQQHYSIDPNRLYNTGQSMGGMTSIAMDIKYPDLFAASLLVACQWDPAKVAPLAGKPLWIIVSEGDNKANPGQDAITAELEKHGATVARATWSAESTPAEFAGLVDAMLARNCTINYTVFRGGDHRYTWQHAYGIAGVRDWLLAQVRTAGQSTEALAAQGDALSRKGDDFGAVPYFQKASAMGDARASEMLGSIYATGRGVARDYARAATYDRLAITQGSTRACTELGLLYMNGKGLAQDYAEALALFEQAGAAGDTKGPRWAGVIYLNGPGGIPANLEKAAACFTLAAERGDISANYYLGYMHEHGLKFAKDDRAAFAYYAKAAPVGTGRHVEPLACGALGRMYENGLGTARDPARALEWYRRGSALGDADSTAALEHLQGQ